MKEGLYCIESGTGSIKVVDRIRWSIAEYHRVDNWYIGPRPHRPM